MSMTGFSLSTDEVASICRNLTGQMAEVPDRIKEIRATEIVSGDLGGTRYADVVDHYIEATQDVIPRLLAQYADEGCALAERLERTLRSYAETEGQNVAGVRSSFSNEADGRT